MAPAPNPSDIAPGTDLSTVGARLARLACMAAAAHAEALCRQSAATIGFVAKPQRVWPHGDGPALPTMLTQSSPAAGRRAA
ncbi:MAG: hypothetical protein LW650_09460 [Planctomycetaceae bacterium]|jgi:hypothetical protein|nr:hypothetical protein [Phycisphaerales bacterium]MCE2653698.1 hypothetical protein [Planctomycetaceae bacterium]